MTTCPYCMNPKDRCQCAEWARMHDECCHECVESCAADGGEVWEIDNCSDDCCDHC